MAIEFYSSIDVNQNDIHTPVIHKLSSAPSSPSPVSGQMYYNTSANTLHYHDGSNFIQVANHADIGSGAMTAFIIEDDDGTEVSISNAEEIKFIGSGLTTNFTDTSTGSDGDPFDLTFTIDAAQTGITSILATDLKIGEDDQTKIDFETADEIHFYANNVEQVYLGDNIFGPQSDSDVDLGATGVRWKDAYVDSITVTGEVDGASLDISGNADIDGTLEADAITVDGTNILTGGIITTLGTIAQDTVTFTSANSTDPLVVIKNTTNDANGPRLQFASDKGAAGADNDSAGEIIFTADDDNQDQVDFATIKATVADASNSAEGGKLTLSVATHDAELQPGLIIVDGDAEDEVDVTIGNGSGSVTTIAGDLTVTGTTTTVNSTTVNLNDHNIVLDSGNSTSAVINGSGITIEGGSGDDATFTYSTTGPKFELKLGSSYEDLQLDQLIAGSLDISGNADIDGTLETDALTIDGTAIVAQATASAVGGVELATAAEVITGTDAARVVTADTLSAKSVVCTIAQSSLTDDLRATITHSLGTADTMVQLFDMTTEAQIYAEIGRTTDDMSTASTSVITVDFGTSPPNDVRAVITSLAGATAGSIAYT
mgnify:CR=1 FL=1